MEAFLKNLLEKWTTTTLTKRSSGTRKTFLNYIRNHTDIIVVFPEEKIPLNDKDDWKTIIKSTVLLYQGLLAQGLIKWNGETTETHIRQISKQLKHHFSFDKITITDKMIEKAVERIMFNN